MPTPSVKRQRKRKRIDEDGDPEFQVAPMVDVLLVLMLFFMAITSTEVLKKTKNLQLPDEKNARPNSESKHSNEIVVNVSWNGIDSVAVFELNGIEYQKADAMQGVLASLYAQNPSSYVVVRADKDTEYSAVSDVMDACGRAGITTVTFAVLIGGNHKNAPAPAAGQ